MPTIELLRELFGRYGRVHTVDVVSYAVMRKKYRIVFDDRRDADDASRDLERQLPFVLSATKTLQAIKNPKIGDLVVAVCRTQYEGPPQDEALLNNEVDTGDLRKISSTFIDDTVIDSILSSKNYTKKQKLRIFAALS